MRPVARVRQLLATKTVTCCLDFRGRRQTCGGIADPSLQSLEVVVLKGRLQLIIIRAIESEYTGSELPADMSSEHSVVPDIDTEGGAPGVARSEFHHGSPFDHHWTRADFLDELLAVG